MATLHGGGQAGGQEGGQAGAVEPLTVEPLEPVQKRLELLTEKAAAVTGGARWWVVAVKNIVKKPKPDNEVITPDPSNWENFHMSTQRLLGGGARVALAALGTRYGRQPQGQQQRRQRVPPPLAPAADGLYRLTL